MLTYRLGAAGFLSPNPEALIGEQPFDRIVDQLRRGSPTVCIPNSADPTTVAFVALRLGSTVINCADLELMTTFWSRALGLTPGPLTDGGEFRVLGGEHVNVSLQVARTPVTARDQMHLDLYTAEKSKEVERLVALGATWVRSSGDPDDDYDVLRDPEGNEFCVCLVPDQPTG